jgi:hypothetical protein
MGRTAVAVLESGAQPVATRREPEHEVNDRLATLSKQIGYGRRLRPGRSHVALVIAVVVGFWVVLSFGRTITQLNAATDRQASLTSETAALTAQLDAGHRELDLIQTDAFQALQARALGIGAPGEIAFSLETGAPAPAHIVPLGATGSELSGQTPLDAWLRLLFGN